MAVETQTAAEAWTIGRLLLWTTDRFAQRGVADARLSAEVLLAKAAGCRRIELYTRFENELPAEALERFRGWVRRAAQGEPIAYLVGEKEFFSLSFHVSPDVLIPRPETEVLVQCAIDHCQAAGLPALRLLDLGTGSGCIAVAVAANLPGATVVATDVSAAALELAESNAVRHGMADRIRFVAAEGLSLPSDGIPEGGFDVILSNPPYVPADGVAALHRSVRDFEPRDALTDGGDGLGFYRAMGSGAAPLLAAGGVVLVEIDDCAASRVIETMEAPGLLVHRRTWRDRVVGGERVMMFRRARAASDDGREA